MSFLLTSNPSTSTTSTFSVESEPLPLPQARLDQVNPLRSDFTDAARVAGAAIAFESKSAVNTK
eukprot:Awhi_evm2s3207